MLNTRQLNPHDPKAHKYPADIRHAAFARYLPLRDKQEHEGLSYEEASLLQLLCEVMDTVQGPTQPY